MFDIFVFLVKSHETRCDELFHVRAHNAAHTSIILIQSCLDGICHHVEQGHFLAALVHVTHHRISWLLDVHRQLIQFHVLSHTNVELL